MLKSLTQALGQVAFDAVGMASTGTYSGERNSAGEMHGHGTYKYIYGTYVGGFKNNMFHGQVWRRAASLERGRRVGWMDVRVWRRRPTLSFLAPSTSATSRRTTSMGR